MIKIGLSQMFKRPLRVILFLILVVVGVAFLSLGVYLFSSTENSLQEIDKSFRTIGTIEQKATGYSEKKWWDELTGSYTYTTDPEYGEGIPLSDFDFPEANYIYKPENRPYFHVSSPEYPNARGISEQSGHDICEFKIIAIYDDILPVEAEITKVYSGTYNVGDTIWFCQHMNKEPVKLEIGKTYVSGFSSSYDMHPNFDKYSNVHPVEVYMNIYSGQMDSTGKALDDEMFLNAGADNVYEVTDGFYETDIGKRVLIYAESITDFMNLIIAIPVNSDDLLIPFYNREVYIEKGREIYQQEYDDGERVCLIPEELAESFKLEIGDEITLNFRDAFFGESPAFLNFKSGTTYIHDALYNANSEEYDFFETGKYTIVGTYGTYGAVDYNTTTNYDFGYGTILIPMKSVKNSYENNMVGNLVLKPYNTSFEIPNGTTGKYMEKINKLGLGEKVTITFYDRGYENLKSGLASIKNMSIILMITGIITTVAVLFLFLFIFIGKEKKRTAVERSLGVPKSKCAAALLVSVMIITILGTALGVFAGFGSSEIVMDTVQELTQEEELSTKFSNWINEAGSDDGYESEIEADRSSFTALIIIFLSVLVFSLIVAIFFIHGNLKKEPMELLSRKNT